MGKLTTPDLRGQALEMSCGLNPGFFLVLISNISTSSPNPLHYREAASTIHLRPVAVARPHGCHCSTSRTEVRATAANVTRVLTRGRNGTSKPCGKTHNPGLARPGPGNELRTQPRFFSCSHLQHLHFIPQSPPLPRSRFNDPPAAGSRSTATRMPLFNIAN